MTGSMSGSIDTESNKTPMPTHEVLYHLPIGISKIRENLFEWHDLIVARRGHCLCLMVLLLFYFLPFLPSTSFFHREENVYNTQYIWSYRAMYNHQWNIMSHSMSQIKEDYSSWVNSRSPDTSGTRGVPQSSQLTKMGTQHSTLMIHNTHQHFEGSQKNFFNTAQWRTPYTFSSIGIFNWNNLTASQILACRGRIALGN